MQQHLRKFAVAIGVAASCAMTLAMTLGTSAAGAAARYRSGSVHTQLVSHVTAGTNGASSGLALTGPDVMAAVVGLLAFCAMAFLVVTLIRRRVSIAS